ncbi:MAG: hypothetical protein IPJ04_01750 [Candidatus Eisenbacteria bacterium]|nr:hypothetical protein [Candidatus Eisenbacteria bacterium]
MNPPVPSGTSSGAVWSPLAAHTVRPSAGQPDATARDASSAVARMSAPFAGTPPSCHASTTWSPSAVATAGASWAPEPAAIASPPVFQPGRARRSR